MNSTTVTSLRHHNLARALQVVHARRSLTRAELTTALGVSRNTAREVVSDLVRRGLLVEEEAPPSGRPGRPTTQLHPGPFSPVAVVAEISPGAVLTGVVRVGRTVVERQEEHLAHEDPHAVIAWLAPALRRLVAEQRGRCAGVAVALYGVVADGHVEVAPNLGWADVPLQEWLARALPTGMPLVIGNDASFAALHEARHGAGVDVGTCLYLYATTGVGGGLTLDGQLIAGRHGYAGEIGHMLINPAGVRCRCGRIGCWETEVDRAALRRRWTNSTPDPDAGIPTGSPDAVAAAMVLQAHADGSPTATAAVLETARWLGDGLGSLLNILDPDRVVLAGALSDLFVAAPATVLEHATARRLANGVPVAELVAISTDQRDAALLGAAERVLQPALEHPHAHHLH